MGIYLGIIWGVVGILGVYYAPNPQIQLEWIIGTGIVTGIYYLAGAIEKLKKP